MDSGSPPSSLESFAKTWVSAWKSHDGGLLQSLFADGGHYSDPYFGRVPKERICWMIDKLAQRIDSLDFTVNGEIVFQDSKGSFSHVCLQWIMTGSVRTIGFKRELSLHGADFIKLQDYKVLEAVTYFDRMQAFKQAILGGSKQSLINRDQTDLGSQKED